MNSITTQPTSSGLTLNLIAIIQTWLSILDCRNGRGTIFWRRLERAEAYLIRRFARDDTAEEREVFDMIWPPVDIGGEG